MQNLGELWTSESWVLCRSWPWHRQGLRSTTALPKPKSCYWGQPSGEHPIDIDQVKGPEYTGYKGLWVSGELFILVHMAPAWPTAPWGEGGRELGPDCCDHSPWAELSHGAIMTHTHTHLSSPFKGVRVRSSLSSGRRKGKQAGIEKKKQHWTISYLYYFYLYL